MSLRAHNLNGGKIKVNDLRDNPIEITVVVVWRVTDTAKAVFDVRDYEDYVSVQSEAALRHLASADPYDTTVDDELSLRGSMEEVSQKLETELTARISKAGVHVTEARIGHLAYAPEIAGAMLQRQQAEAIVAARTRIVDGAVGMVEMVLQRLHEQGTLDLDEGGRRRSSATCSWCFAATRRPIRSSTRARCTTSRPRRRVARKTLYFQDF